MTKVWLTKQILFETTLGSAVKSKLRTRTSWKYFNWEKLIKKTKNVHPAPEALLIFILAASEALLIFSNDWDARLVLLLEFMFSLDFWKVESCLIVDTTILLSKFSTSQRLQTKLKRHQQKILIQNPTGNRLRWYFLIKLSFNFSWNCPSEKTEWSSLVYSWPCFRKQLICHFIYLRTQIEHQRKRKGPENIILMLIVLKSLYYRYCVRFSLNFWAQVVLPCLNSCDLLS